MITLVLTEMESELWEEELGPRDVSPLLSLTISANKLHDDYIYDDKIMRGHAVQKS